MILKNGKVRRRGHERGSALSHSASGGCRPLHLLSLIQCCHRRETMRNRRIHPDGFDGESIHDPARQDTDPDIQRQAEERTVRTRFEVYEGPGEDSSRCMIAAFATV